MVPMVENQGDLSRLMRSCRTLYNQGVAELLRRGVQVSCNIVKIFSFCAFVFADPERAQHIQSLGLNGIDDTPIKETIDKEYHDFCLGEVLRTLAVAVALCKNIRTLGLRCSDYPLELSSHLFHAIVSLKTVQEVKLSDIDDMIPILLSQMQSPVTCASVNFDILQAHADPIQILRPFAKSLVQLRTDFPNTLWGDPSIRFDSLQYIFLVKYDCADFIPEDLAQSVPNLREVEWYFSHDVECDEAEEMRAQIVATRTPQTSAAAWKTLDRLSCNIARTYSMALTCRIRFWEDASLHNFTVKQLHQFNNCLLDIRPLHLSLKIFLSWGELEDIPLIFAQETPSITHLRVSLSIDRRCLPMKEFSLFRLVRVRAT